MTDYWDTVKITVVGDKEVGKSTLNVAYREGEYDTNNPPSMCDEYTLTVRVGTYAVTANIWDCPGGDEFTNIRRVMYENTDVFIVCFAVNDRETFANVTAKWLMRLRGGHMRAVKGIRPVEADPKWDYSAPVILCATKTDRRLFDENCVTTTEGETLAREINAAEYLECSAKAYLGVEHLFQAAAFVGTQKSLGTRDSGWTSELKNAYEDGWCSTM